MYSTPGGKRGGSVRHNSALVLPTSVTTVPGAKAGAAWAARSAMVRTGVAKTTTSAPRTPSCRSVVPPSTAPTATASATVSARRATPTTRSMPGARRSAMPMEPPISPRPTMLTTRPTLGHRGRQLAPQRRGDGAHLPHQIMELLRLQRLRAVGDGFFAPRVHVHHEPVRSRGHGLPGQGNHVVLLAGAVGGVHDDGQVAHLLDDRYRVEVQGVARGGFKGADAPLAQDHVG